MAGLFSAASSSSNPTQGDLSKDVELKEPPKDSISDIAFSSAAELLAVSSWDSAVRIYEIDATGNSQGKAMYTHEGPVLSVAWSPDGTKIVSGGADKAARMVDLQANPNTPTQVAAHELPIKCVKMFTMNGTPMLATGSWDKTVKYWDLRQQQPVGTLPCQDRIYSMDIRDQLLVVGTADRYLNVVNLNDPLKFYKTMQSPLKWQTRVVSCFIDASGFAVGSIEGRCAIQYVEEKDSASNFSFKCHRQNDTSNRDIAKVYSVNDISFHPIHGTFSTAGSDGTFHFWDKDAKHRLKGYPEVGGTISATDFNRTGNIFAYAVSYDWTKGYAFNTPTYPNKIMLHPVQGDECKPRANPKKR
ncbi:WD40 repeat-like protein [Trichodelitschia bisporula]|uniref:WD40 repeat-like protein n=1 Tax=Trichodelitschia bisporula TaxID=703511 RepID=A0A6G1HTI6_9PEZI|nr:WD40 repeat-like protein [Trichodelitschia bisporula]